MGPKKLTWLLLRPELSVFSPAYTALKRKTVRLHNATIYSYSLLPGRPLWRKTASPILDPGPRSRKLKLGHPRFSLYFSSFIFARPCCKDHCSGTCKFLSDPSKNRQIFLVSNSMLNPDSAKWLCKFMKIKIYMGHLQSLLSVSFIKLNRLGHL